MRVARGYLLIVGIGTLLIGVLYVVAPSIFTDPMGFGSLAPEALTDMRATYGGLQIAIGGFLIWTARDVGRQRDGLLLVGLVLSAVAAARALGLVVDGQTTGLLVGVLIFEVLLAAFSWFVLRSASQAHAAHRSP
jgi:hypothetical protein